MICILESYSDALRHQITVRLLDVQYLDPNSIHFFSTRHGSAGRVVQPEQQQQQHLQPFKVLKISLILTDLDSATSESKSVLRR